MTHPRTRRSAVNRRTFLRMVGAGAAVTAGGSLLAGCGDTPGSTGTATQTGRLGHLLPTYQPLELVPPDIPLPPPAASGFVRYPQELVRTITDKPGSSGETIRVQTLNWGPTPPGLGQNAYVDSINEDYLGVPLDFSVQDGNHYDEYLTTILAARDVQDVVVVPSWNTNVPRFPDAVNSLFTDLTDYLQGDNVLEYPMLASFPTDQWRHCFWGERLKAVPFVNDNPFGWALFHRKDLLDPLGVTMPTSSQELYDLGKEITDPRNNVWAFNDIWHIVRQIFKVPGSEGGWRLESDGSVINQIETDEFEAALEFMRKLFDEELVHPTSAAGGDEDKQLFASGQILFLQDGLGVWKSMQRDEQRVTPGFLMDAMPVFADDGDPLVHGGGGPIFYTFIKQGLAEDRVKEILRVLNWGAAPFGSVEYEVREHGIEGVHFSRDADGVPVRDDDQDEIFAREYANQFTFLSGRLPAQVGEPDIPGWIEAYTGWTGEAVQHLEVNPWEGIKLEQPTAYASLTQPTEDKITDILRGRRPLSDLEEVREEWRRGGGEVGRTFYAEALEEPDDE